MRCWSFYRTIPLLLLSPIVVLAAPPPHDREELVRLAESLDHVRTIEASIEVDATVDQLWDYASQSSGAKDWSIYFSHITAINTDEVPDGALGSIRRCYRKADETGPAWDELTIESVRAERRRIWVYNLQNFLPARKTAKAQYFVTQLYRALPNNRSELTFKTIAVPGTIDGMDLLNRLGRGTTLRIFRDNLANIKEALESQLAGRAPHRPHPYIPHPMSLGEALFTRGKQPLKP